MKFSKVLGVFTLTTLWMVNVSPSPNVQSFSSLNSCDDSCRFTLVESIPMNLTFPAGSPSHISTYDAHTRLISLATKSIHISSFYWTMTTHDIPCYDGSCDEGQDIFKQLQKVAKTGSIDLKIAQNNTNANTDSLAKDGAQVRTVDFKKLLNAGVLHTKMWIVDDAHMYVGSANFDWRSYTQVKELGILIENCGCLVGDAAKIFEVYWYLGQPNASIPAEWPSCYSTNINASSPTQVTYNQTKGLVYFSSSPKPFCPLGRTDDINAILDVIYAAKEFVYISVMDYVPLFLYTNPRRFWPVIDDALRKVAYEKNIKVYLMVGWWKHTFNDTYNFLKSLDVLDNAKDKHVVFEVQWIVIPSYTPCQKQIPYARVSHSKYMVTDQHAYIGTSNWSGDYFVSTGGVGFVLNQPKEQNNHTSLGQADLRAQLTDTFLRDWYSDYTRPLK